MEFTTDDRRFHVVNDPGAWGAADPEILVLGISKGFTQARALESGEFDSVPFRGIRDRLQEALRSFYARAAPQTRPFAAHIALTIGRRRDGVRVTCHRVIGSLEPVAGPCCTKPNFGC